MAIVYSASFLNIAATHSAGPSTGCHIQRYRYEGLSTDKSSIEPVQLKIKLGGQTAVLFVRQAFSTAHDHILGIDLSPTYNSSPLLKRAWIFQERLLSRRTLHFHFEELMFECRTSTFCECGEYDRAGSTLIGANKLHTLTRLKARYSDLSIQIRELNCMTNLWLDIVAEYSQLSLSYETDRLPALSGIASSLSERFKTTYLAGLWKEDLPRGLLWECQPCDTRITTRAPAPCAPTWSWASIRFGANLGNTLTMKNYHLGYYTVSKEGFTIDSRLQVVDTQCSPTSENPFGQVSHGVLSIRGATIQPVFCPHAAITPQEESDWRKSAILTFREDEIEFQPDIGSPAQDRSDILTQSYRSRAVQCLLIGNTAIEDQGFVEDLALILDISTSVPGTYERIGLLTIWKNKGWFKDANVKTLTLI